MRLGINTLFLIPGEVGGSETYFREVLLALLGLHPDLEIVFFTNAENDAYLKELVAGHPHAECVPTGIRAMNRFERIIKEQVNMPRLVRRAATDVLWSPGYTCPVFCHCPQVTTIHDMQYKRHTDDFKLPALIATRILVGLSARRSTRLIAVSHFAATEINHFLKIPMANIHATPSATDPCFLTPLDETERRKRLENLGLGDRPFVLAVSNTYPHKQMHLAVEAFAALKDEIPHMLVVVGQPRLGEPRVESAIAEADAGDRILRINYLDRGDLIALYQNADVFVFPSVYEGFGLPVLEALSAGTPVVSTRSASIPEVGGDCVAYFEPGALDGLVVQLREILAWDETQKRVFADAARIHVGGFNWQRTARQTMTCFEEAIAAG